jgi:hypothetical protein
MAIRLYLNRIINTFYANHRDIGFWSRAPVLNISNTIDLWLYAKTYFNYLQLSKRRFNNYK